MGPTTGGGFLRLGGPSENAPHGEGPDEMGRESVQAGQVRGRRLHQGHRQRSRIEAAEAACSSANWLLPTREHWRRLKRLAMQDCRGRSVLSASSWTSCSDDHRPEGSRPHQQLTSSPLGCGCAPPVHRARSLSRCGGLVECLGKGFTPHKLETIFRGAGSCISNF
jgi:hypothetical protein